MSIFSDKNINDILLYRIPESKWLNLHFLLMYFAIFSFPEAAGPSMVIINFFKKYYHPIYSFHF